MIQQIERQFVRTARPLYGHLVDAAGSRHLERRAGVRRASAARARAGEPAGHQPHDGRERLPRARVQRPAAWLRRARHVRVRARPSRPARRSRGAARLPQRRCERAIRRCATRCGTPSDARLLSLAAGEPAIDCFPDRGVSEAIDARAQARGARRRGGTDRPKGSRRCARRSPNASACRRTACSCSRARSRGSTCWRAASSIPATRSSSTGPATSARFSRSTRPARS